MGPCRHIRSKQVLRLMSQPALSFEVGWGRDVDMAMSQTW